MDAPTHPGWQGESIKEAEWSVLMQTNEEHLNGMACIMAQQMIVARPVKKRCETMKFAAKMGRRRKQ